jgi:hypothetical protein
MLNESGAHKRMSLLICKFTARSAVQKLRSEWQVGELATSILSQATEECLNIAFSLECLT